MAEELDAAHYKLKKEISRSYFEDTLAMENKKLFLSERDPQDCKNENNGVDRRRSFILLRLMICRRNPNEYQTSK